MPKLRLPLQPALIVVLLNPLVPSFSSGAEKDRRIATHPNGVAGSSTAFELPERAPSGSSGPSSSAASGSGNSLPREIELLREQLALQQKQVEQLRSAFEEQKRLLEQALSGGGINHAAASGQSAEHAPAGNATLGQVASTTPIIPTGPVEGPVDREARLRATPTASGPNPSRAVVSRASGTNQAESKKPSPLSLRIGDADFTLGGFVDATAIFRSTNVGSGIGTSFGSIPFSNTPPGRLTETRFTAQNSRVSLLATSNVGKNKVKCYIETDFLGFQPTNGFVTSNSNSLRMRLFWVDVVRGKFEVLGGQSWSMMVPNRTGLSPAPSDLFYSQDMDTNYQVGLVWARVDQFRFVYHPAEEWAAGISLENPQQFVGGAVVLPSAFTASQLDQGANAGAPNLHPDIIGKVAFDPKVGDKHMHVDVAGLLRSFRVFNPVTNSSSTAAGGAGSVNANLELVKNFHLIVNTFHSDGGGRYIFGLGPDLIVKPDGNLSLVHASSGIAGFEYQVDPKTMVYSYYGGAYFERNTAIDPKTGKFLGFGFPSSSSSSNKSLQEVTFGVIQTFWKNPRYGALQIISQYSYLTRSPWFVAVGSPKDAHTSMGYANLRYVLP